MNRKWAVLAVSLVSSALVASSIAMAQDEDSKLHMLMENVQKNNAVVLRGVRNPIQFRKDKEKIATAAEDLVKLGKEAREMDEAYKKEKKEKKEWTDLMDGFLKEAENFSKLMKADDTEQDAAKASYRIVSRKCVDCHEVFRIEEEDDF